MSFIKAAAALAFSLGVIAVSAPAHAIFTTGVFTDPNLSGCVNPGTPGGTDGPASSTKSLFAQGGGCTHQGFAEASPGVLRASAFVGLDTVFNFNSGIIRTTAGATSIENIFPTLPTTIDGFSSGSVAMDFSILIDASLGASASLLSGASAAVSFSYNFGGAHGTGEKTADSNGNTTDNFPGGGEIVATAIATLTNGIWSPMGLTLSVGTGANIGKQFAFGPAQALAFADFAHTMIWNGITDVHAFDVSGNPFALPDDFRLQLTGDESGFDYWNSALASVEAPEPSTLALLGAALAGLRWTRRWR